MSFNCNGLGDDKKRRCIFNWFRKYYDSHIIFLQETHSTQLCETVWSNEWGSKIYFSHGTSNSKGCAILFGKKMDYTVHKIEKDDKGRYLQLFLDINNNNFIFTNVYAPTKDHCKDQCLFLDFLIDTCIKFSGEHLIIEGDFNTVLDTSIDKKGGRNEPVSEYRNKL